MTLSVVLLIVGLALVTFGADFLVDGASAIARKARISEFVIGITIVGFGTSCPELVVSLTGAIEGSSDISIGNVIGSNIFNTLLILGLTAVIFPISMTRRNRIVDIPIMVGVTALLLLLGMNRTLLNIGESDRLTRYEGIFFLLLFLVYLYYSFKTGKEEAEIESSSVKEMNSISAVLYVIGGLAALVFGGRLFVDKATEIARSLQVSEKFIAITILAVGTSLPELATCVAAALKKKEQLALGNIIGSNIFNILLILGCSATVGGLDFSGIDVIDAAAFLASAFVLMMSATLVSKSKIDRLEGALFLLLFSVYYCWLFFNI